MKNHFLRNGFDKHYSHTTATSVMNACLKAADCLQDFNDKNLAEQLDLRRREQAAFMAEECEQNKHAAVQLAQREMVIQFNRDVAERKQREQREQREQNDKVYAERVEREQREQNDIVYAEHLRLVKEELSIAESHTAKQPSEDFEQWSCMVCTYTNLAAGSVCLMCEHQRPEQRRFVEALEEKHAD